MKHDHHIQYPTSGKTYTCSMHPEVISQKSGTCPTCGMQLVESQRQLDEHGIHQGHSMKSVSLMSFWEKLKMSMTIIVATNAVLLNRVEKDLVTV